MAIKPTTQNFDPFARAIPGQSFTDVPGLRPYERPALESGPEKVYDVLEKELSEESTAKKIGDILDVGVSAETISDTLMMKCFTEGVCTPDVAEIVKPFIFMSVLEIGAEQDIDDIVMFNDKEDSSELTPEIKLQMMKKLNSERFNDKMESVERATKEQEEMNMMLEEGLNLDEDDEEMSSMPMEQSEESFMDMFERSEFDEQQEGMELEEEEEEIQLEEEEEEEMV